MESNGNASYKNTWYVGGYGNATLFTPYIVTAASGTTYEFTTVQGMKNNGNIYGTLKGNADSATKATQDSDGNTIKSTYLKLSGGTMTGTINMNNNKISNIGDLSFADPGVSEGITWTGGNGWYIYESPDDLTNAAGNLQFVHGSTRRLTINKDGYVDINARLVVKGNGSSYNEGIRILPASNGWSNIFFSANNTLSGEHDGGWLIGRRGAAGTIAGAIGDFTIEE